MAGNVFLGEETSTLVNFSQIDFSAISVDLMTRADFVAPIDSWSFLQKMGFLDSNDAAQTRSNQKLTMAPLVAAIRSMCDLNCSTAYSQLESAVCWFLVWEKNRRTRRKTLEAGKRANTNSTPLRFRVRESNPGHIDGRRALSPFTPSLLSHFGGFWAGSRPN